MALFEERLKQKMEEYAKVYDIGALNDANDKTTLLMLVQTEIMVEGLQEKIQTIIAEDPVGQATDLKKLADLLRDATETITKLQRTLAIDRKSRKEEETGSVADYIKSIQSIAHDFIEKRIIKVYCQECKVMVGRFHPVHEHTAYSLQFECSQCGTMVKTSRKSKDYLFDVKDAEWRRKHRAEIVQPKINLTTDIIDAESEDVIIPEFDKEIPKVTTPNTKEDMLIQVTITEDS